MKATAGAEAKKIDGGLIKIIKCEKDFVQAQFSGDSSYYDVYADDEKGISIGISEASEIPMLKDGKLLTEVSENESLMYMMKEHSGQAVKAGSLVNLKFHGIPANIHFLALGKKKELLQKFTAFGKPDSKDISKIIGTRYINEKMPEAYSFPEKELTEKLEITLRRDRNVLAFLPDGPYSNELVLDLENIRKIQDSERIVELTDVKLLDAKGKSVPIFVKVGDSFGSNKILIQVPKGADGNINKLELLKAKKPIYPDGQKLTGKIKIEIPLAYELFSWPGKPYTGIKVDIKGNDIVFNLGSKNNFSPSDFFVSDDSKYALFPFGKNHTSWINSDVSKIERYWGKPKNVVLRTASQKVIYEGEFEFKVPPLMPTPPKDANPFLDDGPKSVVEKIAVTKLKNFSNKVNSLTSSNPVNEDFDASEMKIFGQMEAAYIKKGLSIDIAKQTVTQIKTSLKGLNKEQRAVGLQSILSALK
jgi:hypothetical protein